MIMNSPLVNSAILLVVIIMMQFWSSGWTLDPTNGFIELPLNRSNFHIHKPYNLPVSSRYSFVHGVHKLWVYSTDKPLYKNSTTHPRTEVRIRGYDYSSGTWQFEGYGYVPSGTYNVCIMQVFGAKYHSYATTLMLVVRNDTLLYYRNPVVATNLHNRWFRLNVIHDVSSSILKVYINGVLKFEAPGHGRTSHFFKFGVYSQYDGSHYMESRWKRIKVLKKLFS